MRVPPRSCATRISEGTKLSPAPSGGSATGPMSWRRISFIAVPLSEAPERPVPPVALESGEARDLAPPDEIGVRDGPVNLRVAMTRRLLPRPEELPARHRVAEDAGAV